MNNNTSITVDEIIKKIDDELNNNHKSRYDEIIIPAIKTFKVKDTYTVDDFTKYFDEEFVDNAFQGILKRLPDIEGKNHYLSNLRDGTLEKEMILTSLRYSSEGVALGVNISGLKKYNILHKIYARQYIGRFVKFLYLLYKLPNILKHIQRYEYHIYKQSKDDLLLEDTIRELKADNSFLYNTVKAFKKQKEQSDEQLLRVNQHMTIVETKITKMIDMISVNNMEEINPIIIQELKNEQKDMLDLMYIAFEDKFRGSKKVIKHRLEVYLPYIQQIKKDSYILDVGCGRGEWLELLKQNNITAKGLDLNSLMAVKAQALGLDAVNEDVISYLKKQPQNSIDAVTGFHIVEHLPFEVMITMLQEALRVVKSGGLVIFETPNPENILVGAHYFYNDPTHKNPLVPVTMEFILQYIGFSNVEIKRLHTYAESANIDPSEDAFINNNFYNSMDFAVIGYKK